MFAVAVGFLIVSDISVFATYISDQSNSVPELYLIIYLSLVLLSFVPKFATRLTQQEPLIRCFPLLNRCSNSLNRLDYYLSLTLFPSHAYLFLIRSIVCGMYIKRSQNPNPTRVL